MAELDFRLAQKGTDMLKYAYHLLAGTETMTITREHLLRLMSRSGWLQPEQDLADWERRPDRYHLDGSYSVTIESKRSTR